MSDYLLRTDTEDEMDQVLEAAGLLVEVDAGGGELVLVPIPGIDMARIGTIPPKYDIDGNETAPGDARYHANLRATTELTKDQQDALTAITVDPPPAVPYRVFL